MCCHSVTEYVVNMAAFHHMLLLESALQVHPNSRAAGLRDLVCCGQPMQLLRQLSMSASQVLWRQSGIAQYLAPYEAYVFPSSLLGLSMPLLFKVTTALVSVWSNAATACAKMLLVTKIRSST